MVLLQRLDLVEQGLGLLARRANKVVDHLFPMLCKVLHLAIVVINHVARFLLLLEFVGEIRLVKLELKRKVNAILKLLLIGVEPFHLHNQDAWHYPQS
jgi:hypothetical protein